MPATIVDMAANFAGVWLYENRGVQDFNAETGQALHRLQFNRKRAETALAEIRGNKRQIDCQRVGSGTTAPIVVHQREPRHGYLDRLGPWGDRG